MKSHTAASQENPSLGVGQGTLLLRGSGFGFRILGLGFLHLLARATQHALSFCASSGSSVESMLCGGQSLNTSVELANASIMG